MSKGCRIFWGSHGCDLPLNHDGTHVCHLDMEGFSYPECSQFEFTGPTPTDEEADQPGRVRYDYADDGAISPSWGRWHETTGFYMAPRPVR